MKAKIAVATLSGKAYYLLVNELKARGLDFLSLTPNDNVPLEIEVVITTGKERHLIKHTTIIVYEPEQDPAEAVEEAIRMLRGKKTHEIITVGVDPGKTFGLAVLSDGDILETATCSSTEETVSMTVDALSKMQGATQIVKVGEGAPQVATELLSALDEALPSDVSIEVVSEAGTSRFIGENLHKRGLRDALSAVKIAERRGQIYPRKTGGKERQ